MVSAQSPSYYRRGARNLCHRSKDIASRDQKTSRLLCRLFSKDTVCRIGVMAVWIPRGQESPKRRTHPAQYQLFASFFFGTAKRKRRPRGTVIRSRVTKSDQRDAIMESIRRFLISSLQVGRFSPSSRCHRWHSDPSSQPRVAFPAGKTRSKLPRPFEMQRSTVFLQKASSLSPTRLKHVLPLPEAPRILH
ncbi:hypothetical protein BJV77DRAFT_743677 [Russula vinacea]|nr:hypothetical protein BJV77DRAFT_743677 [Russula vinacea]